MRRLLKSLSLLVLLWSFPASAAETLHEISWAVLQASGQLPGHTVLPPDASTAFPHLRVDNAQGPATTLTIFTLPQPSITAARYGLTGMVRYQDVQGTGYLELWNVFPDGSRYFSRTLAEAGPLRSLTGSSDWRPFVLPFFNREGTPSPSALILNVVLPGRGTVYLGPVRLVQYRPGEDPFASPGAWWSEPAAGWLGALSGSAVGILGGVIGWLAAKGRARRFVLGLNKTLIGLGGASLALGLLAIIRGQPYAVYYPLLLLGVIGAGVGGLLANPLRKRYEAMELRRIRAADAR